MLSKKQSGFTLIELMIAMAIIAILTTAGLSAYTGYLKTGRDSVRGTLASQVNTEVMNYAGGHGGKPPANAEEFRDFLHSAGDSLGRSAAEISNDTIIQDPLGGKDVCLDASGNADQPCAFHYTAYTDGTYAISYGVESRSSMKKNFYKTMASVQSPATKYGVYIGTAPYIGGPATTANTDQAVDTASGVVASFKSPRIDIVTVSGGSGGSGSGGGPNCDITICSVGQGCVGDVCVNPCGDVATFCAEGETCTDDECVMPIPTCGDGVTIGGYATVIAKDDKCWLATNLVGYYQWGRDDTTFTIVALPPYDWSNPRDDTFWQDMNGIYKNNPCPVGSHVPAKSDWQALLSAETITDITSAEASTLNLTTGGFKDYVDGDVKDGGWFGYYWSSTIFDDDQSYNMIFSGDENSAMAGNANYRAQGMSVRCIVD